MNSPFTFSCTRRTAAPHKQAPLRTLRSGLRLAFMVPLMAFPLAASAGQTPEKAAGSASTPLAPYVLTLPGSVVKLNLVPVPAGSIRIGTKTVKLKPFWIADTETTWEAFDVFTTSGPPSVPYDQTPLAPDAVARPSKSYIPPDRGWGHHSFPAIDLSNLNAVMFCRWLSEKTGKKYRLPTEAEWEYACRAGRPAATHETAAQLAQSAWTAENSNARTHPVGKKLPNAWKLYDMLGNVGEWAVDLDGKPVICGGSFLDKAAKVSPGVRAYQTPAWQETDPQLPKSRWWLSDAPFAGFRIVCEP